MMIGCIGNHDHKGTEDGNRCINVLGTAKTAFVSCGFCVCVCVRLKELLDEASRLDNGTYFQQETAGVSVMSWHD
jgi:hypothetical protein